MEIAIRLLDHEHEILSGCFYLNGEFAVITKLASLSFVGLLAVLFAAQADNDLLERLERMKLEIVELTEEGHLEEAEELEREAEELWRRLERRKDEQEHREHEGDKRVSLKVLADKLEYLRNAERKLQDSRTPGKKRQQLEKIRRQIREVQEMLHARDDEAHQHERHERSEEHKSREAHEREIEQRFHHMHEAIGHLHEAGLPDVAHEVEKRMEAFKHEVHSHHQEAALREVMEQMKHIREELMSLRQEVERLKQK